MRRLFLAIFSTLAPAAFFLPAAASAQGRILPTPCLRICPPGRVCPPCGPIRPTIVRTASDVAIRLNDGVLHYEITETFTNRGASVGEADYLFPLPQGAAFQDLKLSINGELVAGETMNATQAREIYESIVRHQRDPALVEWMGYGLLRARIFPLNPGEAKKVVVRYQIVARREGDALRIDYFRGTSSQWRDPIQPQIQPQTRGRERANNTGNSADNAASLIFTYPTDAKFGTAYSPTNTLDPIQSRQPSGGYRQVAVRGDARDVTILVPVHTSSQAAIAMLPYATGSGDGFAMITLSPPPATSRFTPRDITVVVDVSGSMSGEKIQQARAAVKQLLGTLTSDDRFRIVDFSSDVRTFRDDYVAATRMNIKSATRYIDALEANGSTNIAGALTEALRSTTTQGRLPLVLFITDGEATVGETSPDALAALAAKHRDRTRVFTFGLGADVNVSLIEQLALQGRGTAQFVRPNESIEQALSVTARRLTNPVVTDIRVRAQGVQLISPLPDVPSDIFEGQDLVILTRYRGNGTARLIFEGRTVNGPVTWTTDVRFPQRERTNAFIARLWATQRVGYLSAEKRKNGGSREIDAEIKALGEQYGIPTEFSSYLVLEPGVHVRRQAVQPGAPIVTRATGAQRRLETFESAKQAAAQRAAKSLAAADAAVEMQGAGTNSTVKRVGDRLFTWKDSVWTDSRPHANVEVVRIKPFSDAYFALLTAIPELAAPFALGERVLVVGRRVAVELHPSGVEQLTSARVTNIQQRW